MNIKDLAKKLLSGELEKDFTFTRKELDSIIVVENGTKKVETKQGIKKVKVTNLSPQEREDIDKTIKKKIQENE